MTNATTDSDADPGAPMERLLALLLWLFGGPRRRRDAARAAAMSTDADAADHAPLESTGDEQPTASQAEK